MKLLNFRYLLLLLVFTAFGCSSGEDDVLPPELIVPGVGIPQIKLGDTGQMVFDVFGQTNDNWGAVGGVYQHFLIYGAQGLTFYLENNDSEDIDLTKGVREIVIGSNFNGETAEGIKVGSTRDEVINAYGEPDDVSFFGDDYDNLGLTVVYNDDNLLVTSLAVFNP